MSRRVITSCRANSRSSIKARYAPVMLRTDVLSCWAQGTGWQRHHGNSANPQTPCRPHRGCPALQVLYWRLLLHHVHHDVDARLEQRLPLVLPLVLQPENSPVQPPANDLEVDMKEVSAFAAMASAASSASRRRRWHSPYSNTRPWHETRAIIAMIQCCLSQNGYGSRRVITSGLYTIRTQFQDTVGVNQDIWRIKWPASY